MKTILFNSTGGPLSAKAIFRGNMVANYAIFLREKNSNAQNTMLEGDNLNPEDDTISLPQPIPINDGRRVILETGFLGNNPAQDTGYDIRLEVHQDGQLIGFDNDAGNFSGKGQYSLLFVRLAAQ